MSHEFDSSFTLQVNTVDGEVITVTKVAGPQENLYVAEDGTVYRQDAASMSVYVDGNPLFPASPAYLLEHDGELRAAAAAEREPKTRAKPASKVE